MDRWVGRRETSRRTSLRPFEGFWEPPRNQRGTRWLVPNDADGIEITAQRAPIARSWRTGEPHRLPSEGFSARRRSARDDSTRGIMKRSGASRGKAAHASIDQRRAPAGSSYDSVFQNMRYSAPCFRRRGASQSPQPFAAGCIGLRRSRFTRFCPGTSDTIPVTNEKRPWQVRGVPRPYDLVALLSEGEWRAYSASCLGKGS